MQDCWPFTCWLSSAFGSLLICRYWSLYYRHYCGTCSSKLDELASSPLFLLRIPLISDMLNDFSISIPRCYKDVLVLTTVSTRALLGPVSNPFPTEFTKAYFQLNLCQQAGVFFLSNLCPCFFFWFTMFLAHVPFLWIFVAFLFLSFSLFHIIYTISTCK